MTDRVVTDRVTILNGTFDVVTQDQAVDALLERAERGSRGWIVTVNVAILMMMRSQPALQRFVDRACMVVADGQPLIWVAPAFGTPLPHRVAGIDLMVDIAREAANRHLSVYLMGAEPGVAAIVADRLRTEIPGLVVAGTADGYFGEDESPARAAAVRESGAAVLFVAMGVPRQERFIESQWDDLGVRLAVPVGGGFDVLAGLRRRAPRWVQRVGMEWAFRLVQEPRRLFKRYAVTNAQFAALVARHVVGRRRAAT